MRRFGSLLLGLVLGALALGPAVALPPTRSVTPSAASMPSAISATKIADGSVSNAEFQRLDGVTSAIQTQLDAKPALSSSTPAAVSTAGSAGAASTASKSDHVHALPTAGPGAATYCGGGQYVTSVVLDAYGRTTTVNCATPSSSPAVLVIGSLTGVATTQTYLNSSTTSSTGTTAEGNALEVIVPSGAVIQVRTAVTTAITSGQQCDTYIKTATTPGGTLTTRATNTFTNADGANVAKLSSTYTTASVVYVAVSALCTFSYVGLIYFTAERVS